MLIFLQVFVLHRVCPFCLIVDSSAVAIAYAAFGWRPEASPPAPAGRVRSLWLAAAVLALAFGAALGTAGSWMPSRPQTPVPPEISALWVHDQVTIVEIADFQCPHCRHMHSVLKRILHDEGERVHFVRLTAPMPKHPQARNASRAFLCAGAQGDAMAEALFEADDLTPQSCERLAASVGVSMKPFRACVADPATDRRLDADLAWVKAAAPQGLPVIWVQDRMLSGVQPLAALREAVDAAAQRLRKSGPMKLSRSGDGNQVTNEALRRPCRGGPKSPGMEGRSLMNYRCASCGKQHVLDAPVEKAFETKCLRCGAAITVTPEVLQPSPGRSRTPGASAVLEDSITKNLSKKATSVAGKVGSKADADDDLGPSADNASSSGGNGEKQRKQKADGEGAKTSDKKTAATPRPSKQTAWPERKVEMNGEDSAEQPRWQPPKPAAGLKTKPGEKKPRPRWQLIAAIATAVLVVGGVGGYLIFGGKKAPPEASRESAGSQTETHDSTCAEGEGGTQDSASSQGAAQGGLRHLRSSTVRRVGGQRRRDQRCPRRQGSGGERTVRQDRTEGRLASASPSARRLRHGRARHFLRSAREPHGPQDLERPPGESAVHGARHLR